MQNLTLSTLAQDQATTATSKEIPHSCSASPSSFESLSSGVYITLRLLWPVERRYNHCLADFLSFSSHLLESSPMWCRRFTYNSLTGSSGLLILGLRAAEPNENLPSVCDLDVSYNHDIRILEHKSLFLPASWIPYVYEPSSFRCYSSCKTSPTAAIRNASLDIRRISRNQG